MPTQSPTQQSVAKTKKSLSAFLVFALIFGSVKYTTVAVAYSWAALMVVALAMTTSTLDGFQLFLPAALAGLAVSAIAFVLPLVAITRAGIKSISKMDTVPLNNAANNLKCSTTSKAIRATTILAWIPATAAWWWIASTMAFPFPPALAALVWLPMIGFRVTKSGIKQRNRKTLEKAPTVVEKVAP